MGSVGAVVGSRASSWGWVWALGLCAACLWPGQALAQTTVKPTEAQFQLYQEGSEAFGQGDYKKAVDLFKASLHLGELNITYLNMGRAYFKMGQCDKARESYDKAQRAPAIAQPAPALVRQKIDQYRAELASCPARLTVECQNKGVQITIGDRAPMACDGQPVALAPGQYVIRGTEGDKAFEETVTLQAMQQATITLGGGTGAVVTDPKIRKPKKGGEVVEKEPEGPVFVFGARVGSLISGTGERALNANIGGEVGSESVALTESGGFGLSGYGLYGLNKFFGVGLSAWFFPAVEFTAPDEGNITSGETTEIDLNGMALLTLPVSAIEYFAFVEAGLTFIAALPNDPPETQDESFTGFNFGAGGGIAINLGGFRLSSSLRLMNVDVSRTFSDGNFEVNEDLSSSRLMVDFGVAFGL